MNAKAYLVTPFAQPQGEETRVHKITDFPVVAVLPVAPGEDDRLMIFTSRLRRIMGDGADLATVLARLASRHPQVADAVITLGGQGEESFGRAVQVIRIYDRTRVAQMPQGL